jgi:hypothetical protein
MKMEAEKRKENLKFIINRYDHYYDSVNNKGNVFVAVNTFLLSGIITCYWLLSKEGCIPDYLFILIIASGIFNLFSMGTALLAIMPYLTKSGTQDKSLIYFSDVAEVSLIEYTTAINTQDEIKENEDLARQAHLLAIGLKRKFSLMLYSSYLLGTEIIILSFTGILITITI